MTESESNTKQKTYEVRYVDLWDMYDGEGSQRSGPIETDRTEAIDRAKRITAHSVQENYRPGMSAGDLAAHWRSFGTAASVMEMPGYDIVFTSSEFIDEYTKEYVDFATGKRKTDPDQDFTDI